MAIWDWDGKPRWTFVVDCDEYAGGYERELGSYVVGESHDGETDERSEYFVAASRRDFPKPLPEALFDMRIDDPGDDGYRRSFVSLAPTPGLSNDGNGAVRRLGPGEKPKYQAFHSVAIFLGRRPKAEELDELKARVLAFLKVPPRNEYDHRPVVTGFRLVEETVSLRETVV